MPPGIGPIERRRGLATYSAPTMRAVSTHAATTAIQYPLRGAGALGVPARPRSRRPLVGGPETSSKTLFSSRRKSSLLTSEHLLDREVGPQAPGGAVDPRLGRRGRHPQRLRQLLEREIQVEMEDERQALVWWQSKQRGTQVGVALLRIGRRRGHVGKLDHRPPSRPPRHAALVGDDGEKPGPQRTYVAAQLTDLAPGLDRGLLDGILGGRSVGEHDGSQPIRLVEKRLDQARERIRVAFDRADQDLGALLHQCG